MSQVLYDNIFDSIKNDDLTLFSSLIESNENLCYGRFPLLSICILYNSKKILKKYKNKLINIEKYNITNVELFNKLCK